MNISYMRMAMEKDAASWGGFVKGVGSIARGVKSFASHPVKSTAKKLFWSRAKWIDVPKNIYNEMSSGAKFGVGIAAGGIAASPFFLHDKV
jgi:hypothetical protein